MPTTYTLIASNTLSSSAASITFSSIPNTYTDLVLHTSMRSIYSDTSFQIELNNDTNSIYSYTDIRGDGSAATSTRGSNNSNFFVRGLINRSAYTSNTFATSQIYIPSYTASQNKPVSMYGVAENNGTAAEFIVPIAGLFRSTAAISSIKLFQGGGDSLVSGSSFFLYGIKNS